MTSKWIWAFFLGTVIFGMWMIYDQGIQPRSVVVVKASHFEEPVKLGELVYTAVRARLPLHHFAMVGVQDETQSAIVKAFLNAAGFEVIDSADPTKGTDEQIVAKLKEGKKLLILATPMDAIHFNPSAKVHKLEQASGFEALSFAFVNLPNSRGSELYQKCERKGKYTHTLGCILEDKVKIFNGGRKKLDWTKFVGAMEQEGERTYMIYTFFP
jgi:hypothetical protein